MPPPRESPSTDTEFGAGRLDTAFEALSHRYRRYALYCLCDDEGGPVPVATLAGRVADLEARHGRSAADRDSIRVALRHTHLPALEEGGLVTVDEDGVALAAGDEIASQIELARGLELEGGSG